MLFSSRRDDDADVIRARLRALLDDGAARRGWLPEDDPGEAGYDDRDDDRNDDLDDAVHAGAVQHVWSRPPDRTAAGPGTVGWRPVTGTSVPRPRVAVPPARSAPDPDQVVTVPVDRRDEGRPSVLGLVAPGARTRGSVRPPAPGATRAHDDHDPDHDPDPDFDPDLDRGDGAVPIDRGPTLLDRVGRHRAAGAEVRVTPDRTGARALWVAAVLAGLLVAGWSWLGRPAVDPLPPAGAAGMTLSDPAAPATAAAVTTAMPGPSAAATAAEVVVVAVVGQVVSPGLVTLPAGSRVADAVAAAGGLLPEADPASINAAAVVADGQQIAVGVPGAAAPAVAPGSSGSPVPGGLVDLNTATVTDLDALPGIGPVLAQRISDHRLQAGAFTSVEQLDDVSGIGPTLYAEISPLVTI